jgi:hypothetical protein
MLQNEKFKPRVDEQGRRKARLWRGLDKKLHGTWYFYHPDASGQAISAGSRKGYTCVKELAKFARGQGITHIFVNYTDEIVPVDEVIEGKHTVKFN